MSQQIAIGNETEHLILKFMKWKIWILSGGEIKNISEYKYGVFLQNSKWEIASYSNIMILAIVRVFIRLLGRKNESIN